MAHTAADARTIVIPADNALNDVLLCDCAGVLGWVAVESYVIRGGRPGFERLAVLGRAWLPSTAELFDRVQIGTGMRCIDLGCGGGDVTLELARRVGSDGAVLGIDMDEVKLELARRAASAVGLTNVEFRAMNVYDWTAETTYDLVYCRFVLQHLSRRSPSACRRAATPWKWDPLPYTRHRGTVGGV